MYCFVDDGGGVGPGRRVIVGVNGRRRWSVDQKQSIFIEVGGTWGGGCAPVFLPGAGANVVARGSERAWGTRFPPALDQPAAAEACA